MGYMMRFLALIALLAIAPLWPANADRVITYADDAAAMNGAIAGAQASLDVFLAEMESPDYAARLSAILAPLPEGAP
jgi:hypothetical protein